MESFAWPARCYVNAAYRCPWKGIILKTSFYIGAAVAAALSVSAANAQIVGGSGGLGGAVTGGVRNPGVVTQGSGALRTDVDTAAQTEALRRKTAENAQRTKERTQSTGDAVKSRGEAAASSAAGKTNAVADEARRIEPPTAAANSAVNGSMASDASLAGRDVASTASAAQQTHVNAKPMEMPKAATPATPATPAVPATPSASVPKLPSANAVGKTNAATAGEVKKSDGLPVTAEGEASGNAKASKRGVSASGTGSGSVDTSPPR